MLHNRCAALSRALMLSTILASIALSYPQQSVAAVSPTVHQEKSDPEAKRLVQGAVKSLQAGNLSLATIQLKNALRLDPDNATIRAQLGTVLLQSGDTVSAERELKQARTNGARNEDTFPGLMQAMLANKEAKELLNDFPEPAAADKGKLAAAILRARAMAFQTIGDSPNAISSMERSLGIQRDANGLLTRAQIAVLQSQPQPALKYIDQALALSPGNPSGMMMKAAVLRFNDRKGAIAILDSVIKAHPEYVRAKVSRIELLIELGQTDAAQADVDSVLAQVPSMPVGLFYKALLLGVKNRPQDGWRIAQSLPPEFIQSEARIAIGAAQLASASGNVESANAIMTAYVSRNPAAPEPRLRLAAMRIKMNNPSGALDILAPLMSSQDPRALELIAAVYEKANQPENALMYLRKAEAAGSKSGGLKYQLALADIRQGNTQKGTQELIDVVKQSAGNLAAPAAGIELLIQQSKLAEAQSVVDQAEKLNSKSPIPPYFSGQILLTQRKPDKGLAATNLSLSRDPNYLPSLYARAQIFIAQKKFKEASADLMHVQSRQPADPLSYVKLGEIAALSGNTGQAIDLLKTAIVKSPKSVETRLILARYQNSVKQPAAAEQTLKDALQISPSNPQALALLAGVQRQLGKTAAAVGTNKLLVQKYQQSGAAQFLLASSLLASGDKKGAIAALKRASELSPEIAQYRSALINQQLLGGDADGALTSAKGWEALHKGPDGALMVAETLLRLKRYPEASSVVKKSQGERPDARLALLDSQIEIARGDSKRSLAVLKEWVDGHSTDLGIRQAYAEGLMRTGDNRLALQQYEAIMAAKDDIPDVLNNTAWLVKESNPARALSLASKAWQLSPNSADIADTLGWILLKKGDIKAALPVLQRAHAIAAGNNEVSYHLALALNASGNKVEAKKVLQGALAKGTNFTGAPDARKLLMTL